MRHALTLGHSRDLGSVFFFLVLFFFFAVCLSLLAVCEFLVEAVATSSNLSLAQTATLHLNSGTNLQLIYVNRRRVLFHFLSLLPNQRIECSRSAAHHSLILRCTTCWLSSLSLGFFFWLLLMPLCGPSCWWRVYLRDTKLQFIQRIFGRYEWSNPRVDAKVALVATAVLAAAVAAAANVNWFWK